MGLFASSASSRLEIRDSSMKIFRVAKVASLYLDWDKGGGLALHTWRDQDLLGSGPPTRCHMGQKGLPYHNFEVYGHAVNLHGALGK